MASTVALVYFGGMAVLFFFWIYGIVSFGLDLKNKIVPGTRQYLRGRRKLKEKRKQEKEQEEREQQLY
ncbi:hypothetical protein [Natronoarchaeum rubrum]|uniref:hypothetical protein n=1 Tax=Natronoarchaeum rubrum TaxID=755311 RepID=UPI002112C6C4|nr:hypothetical protein [Natronoarchaeum rubrum]